MKFQWKMIVKFQCLHMYSFSSQQADFEAFVDTQEQQKDTLVLKREQLYLLICGAMLSILKILNIRFLCPKYATNGIKKRAFSSLQIFSQSIVA